ncbi:DUF3800 domain-containing protein [Leisingera sp. JC1]|uniref:DUF3800 domain-containing protein n=1 Tax=Leisingera sp. JC1 TaxID=1855282 RepID=UPI000802F9B2|nr:DUF3800 domain-containing protein [Leisingera sp. JC1]OBY26263.1 hypothetical protein A9D60_19170 [Leisingera sp. JC1]
MESSDLNYDYVLFIDEAGDDGLKRVKPIDENGASEWLVISGLLVRAEDEDKCRDWLLQIRQRIDATQSSTLHFRKLSPSKQAAASELLANLPVRVFTVCSNKKNMRGYSNVRAEVAGGKQWFYNWVVRILMERVTVFCAKNSTKKLGRPGKIKVIFSARGGHSYGQTKAYWELLRAQNYAGRTYLRKYQMDFRTLSFRLVEYVPHYMNAGLQLADIAASAFYQSVETGSKKWSTICAEMLACVMARDEGTVCNTGLVLQPHKVDEIGLLPEQKKIFEHYGYRFR